MSGFVSRGHWRATAGETSPLPGFGVLFSSSVAFAYQWHLGHPVVLTLWQVLPVLFE